MMTKEAWLYVLGLASGMGLCVYLAILTTH
jgi:hypothetical protein